MASPLGEDQRTAAFAAPHTLAWIDLCALLIFSFRAPEKIFGYDSTTHKSHMLRVVHRCHRGNMDDNASWFQGQADFCQHGPLALAKEAFAGFFGNMPVGINLSARKNPNLSTLLIPRLYIYCNLWT